MGIFFINKKTEGREKNENYFWYVNWNVDN